MDLYCGKFFQNNLVSCGWGGGGSIGESFFSDPFFSGGDYPPFFGKTCPFTSENHIHIKTLKMQGFLNN
jgi:hypothetical protein